MSCLGFSISFGLMRHSTATKAENKMPIRLEATSWFCVCVCVCVCMCVCVGVWVCVCVCGCVWVCVYR